MSLCIYIQTHFHITTCCPTNVQQKQHENGTFAEKSFFFFIGMVR